MKIITAANKRFEQFLNISVAKNASLGYESVIYNLDKSLNYGIPFKTKNYIKKDPLDLDIIDHPDLNRIRKKSPEKYEKLKIKEKGKSPYKVDVLFDAVHRYPYEKTLIWMDADAYAIRPLDEIDQDDSFDIGVTLRNNIERQSIKWHANWSAYINAGVIFLKPSMKVLNFLDIWNRETMSSFYNSDQHGLNNILFRYSKLNKIEEIIKIDDIRIKIFSTEEYNWYYWPNLPIEKTKIVHLKGNSQKDPKIFDMWKNYKP